MDAMYLARNFLQRTNDSVYGGTHMTIEQLVNRLNRAMEGLRSATD
jgi:hypothetical protein